MNERVWEVCIFSEEPDPRVRISLRTRAEAYQFIEKALTHPEALADGGRDIYNATLWSHAEKAFDIFYLGRGGKIVRVMNPYFLTRDQAARIYEEEGKLYGLPERYQL